jgi:hypothetical protein
MARLPATEMWDKDHIQNRLKFLEGLGAREDSDLISRAHALTLAAELALATEDFHKGMKSLHSAFILYAKLPEGERPPTPIALLGAVLREADVRVDANALFIKCSGWKNPQHFPWTAPTPVLASGIGGLLGAAMASHRNRIEAAVPALLAKLPPRANYEELFGEVEKTELDKLEKQRKIDWQRRRVMLLAANAPETGMLAAFGLFRNANLERQGVGSAMSQDKPNLDSAWPFLLAREERYAAQIRLAVQDVNWPFRINPLVPLIDWPLLCWELTLSYFPIPRQTEPSVLFIRRLAHEISPQAQAA